MTDLIVGYGIIALAVVLIGTTMKLRQVPTFGFVLLNRWVRWLLFGFGIAYLLRDWNLSERPFWALAPSFLLLWILFESVYTWLAVKALSISEIPVYPKYRETSDEVAWPVLSYFLSVKEEIRSLGFSREANLTADLGGSLKMRALLYFSEDRKTRLQVVFAPRANGCPALFLVFSCKNGDNRWVTDNVWLPFGGIFPGTWSVSRHPFARSAKRLHEKHSRNMKSWAAEPEPFGEDAVETLNAEQDSLDRASTDGGILVPRGQRPEFGKLTGDGKYRVWKQILLLNYLGRVGNRVAG